MLPGHHAAVNAHAIIQTCSWSCKITSVKDGSEETLIACAGGLA